MEAKCAIHEPLFDAEDDIEILDLIMIPELHLHIGIVNKLIQVLNDKWGDDELFKWLALRRIKSEKFYNRVSSYLNNPMSLLALEFICGFPRVTLSHKLTG